MDASRAFVEKVTGTERYSREVIERLVSLPEAGEQEWVWYVRQGQKSKIEGVELKSKVKVVEIPMKFLWTQVGLAYRTWVDRLDVLWVPAHTLPALRKPGVKTVVTIHGIEYEWLPAYENAWQRWYLPLSTQYAVHSADRVIAVSRFTKRQLVERLGADEGKIVVIYEGASGNAKKKGRSDGILQRLGLEPKHYLLFVGTIQPRKNLERLVEAFAGLGAEFSDLKLVIAGKRGWKYAEVLAAPKKFGVEARVVFAGYVSDAERQFLLQKAVVYVQPSITEGFGLPVLEAWQAEVPVVSSGGGALAEILGASGEGPGGGEKREVSGGLERTKDGGGAGAGFDPYDVGDMMGKLRQVLGSRKLQQQLIERGKVRLKGFDWDRTTEKTYKVITNVT